MLVVAAQKFFSGVHGHQVKNHWLKRLQKKTTHLVYKAFQKLSESAVPNMVYVVSEAVVGGGGCSLYIVRYACKLLHNLHLIGCSLFVVGTTEPGFHQWDLNV